MRRRTRTRTKSAKSVRKKRTKMNKLVPLAVALALAGCGGGTAPPPTIQQATAQPAAQPASQADPAPSLLAGYWVEPGGGAPFETSTLIATGSGQFFAVVYHPPDNTDCNLVYSGTISASITGVGFIAELPDGRLNYTLPGDPPCGGSASAEAYQGTLIPTTSVSLLAQGTTSTLIDEQYIASVGGSITGSYTLTSGDVLAVASNGIVTLQEAASGCTFNGSVTSTDQTGVYALSVIASGCTSLPWNGLLEEGLISFQEGAFGGTEFLDANNNPTIKLFQ
jgi:hypothetical protein